MLMLKWAFQCVLSRNYTYGSLTKCNNLIIFSSLLYIIKIIIITRTMIMVLSSWLRVIARVHPVHAMNAEQRHMAADLWTKPTDWSHRPACRRLRNHIHHHHLLLLGLKADTHFTIPQWAEGWVDLDGWLHTQTVYLRASSHPSK